MASSPEQDSEKEPGIPILRTYLSSATLTSNTSAASSSSTSSTKAEEEAVQSLLKAYDSDVELISDVLIDVVQDQPAGSVEQVALVKIVSALRNAVSEEDGNELGIALRQAWNYFDPEDSDPDQSLERERWLRLNAYCAHLVATAFPRIALGAIWTLRSALEDSDSPDGNVPAAAQWMIYAGKELYLMEEGSFGAEVAGMGQPSRAGRKFKDGKNGFSRERWHFWRGEFEKLAGGSWVGEVKDSTSEWARKAAEAMKKVEAEN